MTGVAVKVTVLPVQTITEGLAAMLRLTGSPGFTVIVTLFDVAGEPVAQVAFEVRIQVTILPFVSVEFV